MGPQEKEEGRKFWTAEEIINATYEKYTDIVAKGLLPAGGQMIISGSAGIGKSLLRMEFAIHLVMGWTWLGFEIPTSRKVCIFQYENTPAMEQTRLKKMCFGLGIRELSKGNFTFCDRRNRIDLTLKRDRQRLHELVQESEAEVIMFDCLSNLHSVNENDNIKMREVLDTITEVDAKLGTSSVVFHHFGKPVIGLEDKYRTRGASSIIDWATTAAVFTAKPHESRILRKLEFVKVRNGPVPKPLLLERDENFLLDISYEESLCPPSKVKDILEQQLDGVCIGQKALGNAIVREIGCSQRSAWTFIQKAIEMKTISVVDNGPGKRKKYHVTE